MKAFDYIAVETIAEACSVLAGHGAELAVLAGGTDLLIELRRGTTKAPKVVLDISGVAELGGIDEADGSHHHQAAGDACGAGALGPAAAVRAAARVGGCGDRVAADPGSRDGGRQHHERRRVRGYRAAAHCAGRDGDAAIEGGQPGDGPGRSVRQAVSDQSEAGRAVDGHSLSEACPGRAQRLHQAWPAQCAGDLPHERGGRARKWAATGESSRRASFPARRSRPGSGCRKPSRCSLGRSRKRSCLPPPGRRSPRR